MIAGHFKPIRQATDLGRVKASSHARCFKLCPWNIFYIKTLSRKHFFIQKFIPQTFFQTETLSRKHFFIEKP